MNRIKELRMAKVKTLDGIAAETGIKRGTFNNYENGKTESNLNAWFKLARYFNVSLDYLTGFSNERKWELWIKLRPYVLWMKSP